MNTELTDEEMEALQLTWCGSKSTAIEQGAKQAVHECVLQLEALDIPLGTVCEAGPQYGFGLQEWNKHTAAYGLEPVPEFHIACKQKGLACYRGYAERIDTYDGWDKKANWYLRDTAEHFYDREKAFRNILDHLDDWIYISIPIEPDIAKDEAHLGQFRSRVELDRLLAGLEPVWGTYREPGQKVGRLTGIWRKENATQIN